MKKLAKNEEGITMVIEKYPSLKIIPVYRLRTTLAE